MQQMEIKHNIVQTHLFPFVAGSEEECLGCCCWRDEVLKYV